MSDYHITQEQVLDVRANQSLGKVFYGCKYRDLETCPCEESNTACKQHDPVMVTMTVEELQAYANAVLDKVLGEPVAWDVYVEEQDNGYLIDSLDDPQWIDDATNHNAIATPLYAPKDQS